MRQLYLALGVFTLFSISACSKSIFYRTEERLEGTWELEDVRRFGFGRTPSFPFTEGTFTFTEGGTAEYSNRFGDYYRGSWDLRSNQIGQDCYYDDWGNRSCDTRDVYALNLTLIDFNAQDVRTEFFEEIRFFSRRKFKAYIHRPGTTWVFVFIKR